LKTNLIKNKLLKNNIQPKNKSTNLPNNIPLPIFTFKPQKNKSPLNYNYQLIFQIKTNIKPTTNNIPQSPLSPINPKQQTNLNIDHLYTTTNNKNKEIKLNTQSYLTTNKKSITLKLKTKPH
jgi:hypothetical protein